MASVGARTRALWVIALAGFAVYALSLVMRPAGALLPWSDLWVANGVLLLLAFIAWERRTVDLEYRPAVVWFAVSLLSYAVANTTFYLQEQMGWQTTPSSIADIGYLGFYPAMLLALQRASHQSVRGDVAFLLDVVISALGASTMAAFFLAPVLEQKLAISGASWLEYAVGIAYPLCDVLLIGCIAAALAGGAAKYTTGLTWVGLGLLTFAFGDYIFAIRIIRNTYVPGELLDVTWMLGCLIIAIAVTRIRRSRGVRPRYPSWAVPLGGGMLALGVLTAGGEHAAHELERALAVSTLLASFLRWIISYRRLEHLAELRAQATTDDLTGLSNRRAFFQAIEPMLARQPASSRVAVALIDLDDFKSVNDTLGHSVGNIILIRAAESMRWVAGPQALVARLGGDEFAIVAAAESLAVLPLEATLLAQSIDALAPADGMLPALHVSAGISFFPDDALTADELLRIADERMYDMKIAHQLDWMSSRSARATREQRRD